ncbi:MAG: 8-amino-7-oxononanoate synthase [Gemmataceae bacterium]|nr:8-amino-7-oxononanoate synthase [Gemmataceae bacterium]MDW8266267.1 8-amino-7-oxononanoate synthase [Gemmataceae bacterium]
MSCWIDDELDGYRRGELYRRRRRPWPAGGGRLRLAGRLLVNFSANDYLGLANDPRLARAAAHAARRYGCGATASPLVSGYSPPLRRLEADLAQWQATESALVFSSGYAANLAILSALADRPDAIFSDELNHASLIDGCRLSRASIHVYRHADVQHLHELLRQTSARRRFIVTDAVFSMEGDWAPLPDLLRLAREFDALLVVDEAHATGLYGATGRGLCEELGVSDAERLVKIGTLSKALGTQGGFVCGRWALIDWLVNRARPYIFSTALAPPVAAAARRAVHLAREEPERRRKALALADGLRQRLLERGWPPSRSRSPIVPVVIGEARAAVRLSERLQTAGLLVPAIRPPSVPAGTARLRISVSAAHAEEDIERLAAALGTPADALSGTGGSSSHGHCG